MKLLLLSLLAAITLSGYVENYENNWYVIVNTSKFFFNYRHTSNAISFYKYLKDAGIKDDRIILMVSETYSCDPRNVMPGVVFNDRHLNADVACDDIEIDYKTQDLEEAAVINLLRGYYEDEIPDSKKLLSDKNSDVMIYMTGHSGEEFFKVQDTQIIYAADMAKAVEQMH